jgi:SAM-dependent methyltransferase
METRELLRSLACEYPARLIPSQLMDVERMAFALELVRQYTTGKIAICDIGGGIGLFSVACAALGWQSILVDDFGDAVNLELGDAALGPHRKHGVQVIARDVAAQGLDFAPASLDVFTCFDSMEHWHNSPKRLFHSVMSMLRPGGLFVLSGPNCVNLRKRLMVPLGYGRWTPLAEWYEKERFRSHVREPDVSDLRYIGRDMGLANVRILGRNWGGLTSRSAVIRTLSRLADPLLRLHPPLCSDIYLVGTKPA